MYENLLPRFLRYVKTETRSNPKSTTTPSTQTQVAFAQTLKKELEDLGMSDVVYNETNGFVIATLPSNTEKDVRSMGFIAHMDTADFNAVNVNPQIIENYDGESTIKLDQDGKFTLNTTDFPNLKKYQNQTLITTDGTTLLGADDKSGIAEIMTAMEILIKHPTIKHGTIRVALGQTKKSVLALINLMWISSMWILRIQWMVVQSVNCNMKRLMRLKQISQFKGKCSPGNGKRYDD
ncbi:hypothetical protein HW555_014398 [Spodoptera exigua]|uniref:Tripeptide aminopeptidase n=1 Tax=Spodoptera exigua TaxID=7107 RepID=A0A835G3K9_SPOEX|nr:hypothetical protein HW555_014398 [Spodoptera exigua]